MGETENPTVDFLLDYEGEIASITVEFKFSDNAEKYIDIPAFVRGAAALLHEEMTM